MSRRQKARVADDEDEPIRRQKPSDRETMQSLRKFVKEMQKSRGRAVEMRLAVLCAIAVGLRVFYSPRVADSAAAQSIILFILIGVLVIVLTTWLDYFPSKLESLKLRNAGGQGLPLACLLPSTVCVALMSHVADHQPQLLEPLNLYLVLCCTASVATILPTCLYSAPYPNSIILYNLLLMVAVFIINAVLGTPFFPLLLHCCTYSVLVPFFLNHFPESFTLCEASLLGQGLSLLVTDTVLLITKAFGWYDLDGILTVARSDGLLFLETGLTGFILCCVLFSFCLYKIAATDDKFYIHVWSLAFLQLSFLLGVFGVLPCLGTLLKRPPVLWMFGFIMEDQKRIFLVLFWIVAVGVALIIVFSQSTTSRFLSVLKVESPSSLWMRKWFHLLALAVYIPGIIVDPPLLSLAAAVTTVAFFVIELVRLFRIWPLGEPIHRLLIPFVDSRDEGDLILTHSYLLLGFSVPVWLFPMSQLNTVTKLSMYAGVLSLGVGDSIAAVSGTLIGRNKWPGTNKTVEGTLMSVFSQFIVGVVIVYLDQDLPSLSQNNWVAMGVAIVSAAVMEAYTHQVDNLVLGVFLFSILIAFL